ncbi:MAG: sugar phosphate isomerase/epimerase [Firmicutes bacterium]|nr:sugar phosphate isomerase/epimerase [Bacillota bacterium]
MKLGVVSLSIGFLEIPEAVRFIKEIGGKTFELSTAEGVHRGSLDFTESGRHSLANLVQNEGLSITSVAGYSDFTLSDSEFVREQLEGLERYAELAQSLGVKFVRVMGGNAKPELSKPEMVSNIIAGFKQAVQIAEKYDVIFALENHGTLVNDGPTLVKIIEEVNSPYLRLTMDTGNFCWAGNSLEDAYDYFAQVSPYVVNVHLKDFVYENDEVQFVPLGEGLIDFKKVFNMLGKVDYQGSILCEYEGVGDPRVLMQDGTFYRDEVMDQVKNATKSSLEFLRSITEG